MCPPNLVQLPASSRLQSQLIFFISLQSQLVTDVHKKYGDSMPVLQLFG